MAFFEDKKEEKAEETPAAPTTIKVGEKEYTQEELSRKVGLGELADELETKWNTKIDRLYPEYTKSTQELSELRKYREDQERLALEQKSKKGEELSPEETRKQALSQARELGIITKDEVNTYIASFLQARDLIDDTETVVSKAIEAGKPKTTAQDLINYMNETGIKNPEIAYKAKYDSELDTWKQEQLKKVKQDGMHTLNTSSAGGKQPEMPKLTTIDSLRDALKSRFHGN